MSLNMRRTTLPLPRLGSERTIAPAWSAACLVLSVDALS